jgi:hypothetical protein
VALNYAPVFPIYSQDCKVQVWWTSFAACVGLSETCIWVLPAWRTWALCVLSLRYVDPNSSVDDRLIVCSWSTVPLKIELQDHTIKIAKFQSCDAHHHKMKVCSSSPRTLSLRKISVHCRRQLRRCHKCVYNQGAELDSLLLKHTGCVFFELDGAVLDIHMDGHRVAFNKSLAKMGYEVRHYMNITCGDVLLHSQKCCPCSVPNSLHLFTMTCFTVVMGLLSKFFAAICLSWPQESHQFKYLGRQRINCKGSCLFWCHIQLKAALNSEYV